MRGLGLWLGLRWRRCECGGAGAPGCLFLACVVVLHVSDLLNLGAMGRTVRL